VYKVIAFLLVLFASHLEARLDTSTFTPSPTSTATPPLTTLEDALDDPSLNWINNRYSLSWITGRWEGMKLPGAQVGDGFARTRDLTFTAAGADVSADFIGPGVLSFYRSVSIATGTLAQPNIFVDGYYAVITGSLPEDGLWHAQSITLTAGINNVVFRMMVYNSEPWGWAGLDGMQLTYMTATQTPTFTVSPTITETHTVTESFTHSPSGTITVTSSPSDTASPTSTITFSFTASHTPSITNTNSPTDTVSPTSTGTSSLTTSLTPTITITSTISPTFTVSPTSQATQVPTAIPNTLLGVEGKEAVFGPVPAVLGAPLCLASRLNVSGAKARLYNFNGDEVAFQGEENGGLCLKTEGLAGGVYMARLEVDGRILWQKIVLVR
jgi:hypothetical protein